MRVYISVSYLYSPENNDSFFIYKSYYYYYYALLCNEGVIHAGGIPIILSVRRKSSFTYSNVYKTVTGVRHMHNNIIARTNK